MGWYQSKHDPDVMLGDEAFDLTYDYYNRLSELYKEKHNRSVTLEELRSLLQTSLRVAADAYLEDFDTTKVTDVTIKTQSKTRKQPHKPGDLFVIPLGDGYFAYGRIMQPNTAMGLLVEVFSEVSRGVKDSIELIDSSRLFHPVYMFTTPFDKWEWQIVESDPDYVCEDCDELEFVMGDPTTGYRIVQGKKKRPATAEEIKGLEETVVWAAKPLEKRIRKELERQGRWPPKK
jgi:Immunity protein 26